MAEATGAGRWPALDGMRAVAVGMVTLFHLFVVYRPSWNPLKPAGGFVGITVFFVLSGFLITSLLLAEHDRSGRISVKAFYQRRALRLFPALAVMLAVAGAAAALAPHQRWSSPTLHALPWVVLYAGNWSAALWPVTIPLGALGQTWSLAVEEQFYLLWPLVLLLIVRCTARRSRVGLALGVLAGLDMVYRWLALAHLGFSFDRVYYGTDTQADGLLLGSGLAFLLAARQGRPLGARSAKLLDVATVLSVAGLALLAMRMPFLSVRGIYVGLSAATLCSGVIVANLVTRPLPPLHAVLTSRPFLWVGRRSYGIYLWSTTTIFLVEPAGRLGLSEYPYAASVLILSVVTAAISYRLVERPFLRLKGRLEPARAQPTDPKPSAPTTGPDHPSRLPVPDPVAKSAPHPPGEVGGLP